MTTNWGILATGRIAHKLADGISHSATGKLVAVGSRNQKNADVFAETWQIERSHGSYEQLLQDPEVDAIYVSTPHPQHAQWTIRALEEGKHVLCEKPMGLNHAEVMAMVHAAQANERILLEAFMYRMHPQTQKLRELIDSGEIGEVRHIHATFGFHAPYNPKGRLFASELGGGGIMDVGCYPVSMARMIAGSEPIAAAGHGKLSAEGIDLYAAAILKFENGVSAHIATGVGQQLDNGVAIFGTKGSIRVAVPWGCPDNWQIELTKAGKKELVEGKANPVYTYEIDEINRLREAEEQQSPAMDWEDSLGNAFVLDLWRREVGVEYPQEQPATMSPQPIHGGPIQANSEVMKYQRFNGLGGDLSRLVLGCDNQPNLAHATTMFDQFFELGGNVFDTAHIYGGGRMETYLGHWLKSRGVRSDVYVIGKGAHTPLNRPEHIRPQLVLSLERLQTEHIDIYFLHRDNDEVPVDEWIDALNEVWNDSMIKSFGGSNWTFERIAAANEYANENTKEPFTAVSNQFSLAYMIDPVWAGCISAREKEYVAFLQANQLALFPWSSQARGFFTSRADSIQSEGNSQIDQRSWSQPPDPEMRRCWFSEENLERRERPKAMPTRKGVDPINIALAFVLHQDFPTFPLIGPRFMWETTSSARALSIELSTAELQFLDLEFDSLD